MIKRKELQKKSLAAVMAASMTMSLLPGTHEITEKEQDFEMNGYCIHAFRVNHNVTCYGYTLEIKRQGRFDVERARRQEIPQKFWSRLQKGEIIVDGR